MKSNTAKQRWRLYWPDTIRNRVPANWKPPDNSIAYLSPFDSRHKIFAQPINRHAQLFLLQDAVRFVPNIYQLLGVTGKPVYAAITNVVCVTKF